MPDFIPRSDTLCLAWSMAYVQQIAADPARFGVSPANAAALVSAQADFAQEMAVTSSPATRTPSAIISKNTARQAMEARVRLTANSVAAQRRPTK